MYRMTDEPGPDPVMETLKAAERTLDPSSGTHYEFASWESCTVGHIYRAARARGGTLPPDVYSPVPDSVYHRALSAVAAVGGPPSSSNPAVAVSNATSARSFGGKEREAALKLVREAIAERERWALRRLYALTGGFLAFFAVFFVGSLHEWAWYALAGPYLGAAACAAGVVGAGVWWGRG